MLKVSHIQDILHTEQIPEPVYENIATLQRYCCKMLNVPLQLLLLFHFDYFILFSATDL